MTVPVSDGAAIYDAVLQVMDQVAGLDRKVSAAMRRGWQCPACLAVHSPDVAACGCPAVKQSSLAGSPGEPARPLAGA